MKASGPRDESDGFDPYSIDDVIAAERATHQYDRRKSFVASYAWAIPSREAIDRIANAVGSRKLLEVCAGSGLWASLLAARGVEVVASDLGPPPSLHYVVHRIDAEAAVKQCTDCAALMLSWPPHRSDCAFRALQAFEGDLLVFVGDGRFTANERFFAALASDWAQTGHIQLDAWPGTQDAVRIYQERKSATISFHEKALPRQGQRGGRLPTTQ